MQKLPVKFIWHNRTVLYRLKPTEEEGRNNPRAPFYAVYKFILDDLASAEELLSDYQRPTKNLPCTPVVHGLMARMWLNGISFRTLP